jgi:hypothetical protein
VYLSWNTQFSLARCEQTAGALRQIGWKARAGPMPRHVAEPGVNIGEMIGKDEGRLALKDKQSIVHDALQRRPGKAHRADTERLIQLANGDRSRIHLSDQPGMLWLGMEVQQEPTWTQGAMDVSQGAHGAFRGDTSQRPGEDSDIEGNGGQLQRRDIGHLKRHG